MLIVSVMLASIVAAVIVGLQRHTVRSAPVTGSTVWRRVWEAGGRVLVPAAVGGAAIAVVASFMLADRVQGFGGAPASIGTLPAWAVNLIYFLAMIVGMLCQALFDAIRSRQPGVAPKLDAWQLALPLLISPIVFGVIYTQLPPGRAIKLVTLILAFQNGFFWQDLMASLGQKRPTGSGAD